VTVALATFVGRVADINRATAGNWGAFAAHRARLTSLIHALCGPGVHRLAILGAGNCNDIDLKWLLTRVSRIQLLDLDGEAVEHALIRQGLARCRCVEARGGVDLTGAAAVLARWSPMRVTNAEIDRYEKQCARMPALNDLLRCNVIVSACLLSQLISPLVDSLGAEHPRLLGLVQRVRDQHLQILIRHLRRGGRALLASDFVSSDTCPALLDAPENAVESVATAALQDGNFFTGTNPLVVLERLQALGGLKIGDIHLLRPWRWRISHTRAFLVYALTFRAL
jgi:hypothetical protein